MQSLLMLKFNPSRVSLLVDFMCVDVDIFMVDVATAAGTLKPYKTQWEDVRLRCDIELIL